APDHAPGARFDRRSVGRGRFPAARARPEDDGSPGALADAPHHAAGRLDRDRRRGARRLTHNTNLEHDMITNLAAREPQPSRVQLRIEKQRKRYYLKNNLRSMYAIYR